MTPAGEIEAVAARWIARLEGGDWSTEDEAALAAWLDETMAHKAAFWRLRYGWAAADRVGALGFHDLPPGRSRLRRWVRSVPALHRIGPRIGGAVAASLALVMAIGGYALWSPGERSADPVTLAAMTVQTPVGVQRTVKLNDGSRIELNTATTVRTASAGGGREVWLDRGEAYFDIAHRPEQPFVVHAGPRTVTVLGTRFTVRRDGDKVTVAVLSGRVRVEDASAGTTARAAVIGRGDIAYARSHGTLVALAAPARVDAMTGWRNGQLVFDNQRLADAVADFNRYTDRPIRIADPAVADIRIGGTFQIGNSAGFLDLLHSAYGLEVRSTPGEVVVGP